MAKFQYNRFLEHSGKPKKPPLLSQRMEDNRISFRIDEVKELNDKLWLMGKDTPLKTGFKIKEEDKPTFSPLIPPTWSDREFTQWTNSFELDEIRRDFIFDIGDFDTDTGIDLELPPWFIIFYPNESGSGQTGTQDKPDTVQTTTQIPEGTEVPLLGLTLSPIATQHTTPESPLVYTVTLLNFDGEAEPVDYDMLVPINISSDGAIDVDYELSNIIPASAFGIEQGDFYDVAAFAIIPKGETSVDIIVTPINPGKTEPVEVTMAVMPIFAFTKDFNPIDNPEVGSPDGTSPIDNLIMPEVESTQTGYLTPSLLTADYQFIPSDQDTDLPLEDKIPQSEHCSGTSQTAPYLPGKGFYLGTIETTIIASANIETYPSTTTSFTITPIDPDATQYWGLGDPVNMTVTDTDNAKVLTINVSGGTISDSHIVHRGSIPIVTSDPFTPTNILISPSQWKNNDDNPSGNNPSGKIDTTSAMPPYKPSLPGKNPTSLNGQKGAPNKYDFTSPPLWDYTVSFPNNAPPGAFIKPTVGAEAIKANPYNPAVIQFPDKIGVDVPAQVWNNNNSNPLQVGPLACLNYRIQVFLELYSTYPNDDPEDTTVRIPEGHEDPLQIIIRIVLLGDVRKDYSSEEMPLAVSLAGTATPDTDYTILGEGQTPISGTGVLADYRFSENVLGVYVPAGVLNAQLKEVTIQVPVAILLDEEEEGDETIEVTPLFPEQPEKGSTPLILWESYETTIAIILGQLADILYNFKVLQDGGKLEGFGQDLTIELPDIITIDIPGVEIPQVDVFGPEYLSPDGQDYRYTVLYDPPSNDTGINIYYQYYDSNGNKLGVGGEENSDGYIDLSLQSTYEYVNNAFDEWYQANTGELITDAVEVTGNAATYTFPQDSELFVCYVYLQLSNAPLGSSITADVYNTSLPGSPTILDSILTVPAGQTRSNPVVLSQTQFSNGDVLQVAILSVGSEFPGAGMQLFLGRKYGEGEEIDWERVGITNTGNGYAVVFRNTTNYLSYLFLTEDKISNFVYGIYDFPQWIGNGSLYSNRSLGEDPRKTTYSRTLQTSDDVTWFYESNWEQLTDTETLQVYFPLILYEKGLSIKMPRLSFNEDSRNYLMTTTGSYNKTGGGNQSYEIRIESITEADGSNIKYRKEFDTKSKTINTLRTEIRNADTSQAHSGNITTNVTHTHYSEDSNEYYTVEGVTGEFRKNQRPFGESYTSVKTSNIEIAGIPSAFSFYDNASVTFNVEETNPAYVWLRVAEDIPPYPEGWRTKIDRVTTNLETESRRNSTLYIVGDSCSIFSSSETEESLDYDSTVSILVDGEGVITRTDNTTQTKSFGLESVDVYVEIRNTLFKCSDKVGETIDTQGRFWLSYLGGATSGTYFINYIAGGIDDNNPFNSTEIAKTATATRSEWGGEFKMSYTTYSGTPLSLDGKEVEIFAVDTTGKTTFCEGTITNSVTDTTYYENLIGRNAWVRYGSIDIEIKEETKQEVCFFLGKPRINPLVYVVSKGDFTTLLWGFFSANDFNLYIVNDEQGNETVELAFSEQKPSNNNFGGAVLLEGQDVSVRGNNYGADQQSNDSEPELSSPTQSVWYKWVAPSSTLVTIHTLGSPEWSDTAIGIYTGAELDSLTLVGRNDDAAYQWQGDNAFGDPTGIGYDWDSNDSRMYMSAVQFTPTEGTTYYIQVDGWSDTQWSFVLSITTGGLNVPTPIQEETRRADIYRFDTQTLKWKRMPNAVSAISPLTGASDFISYHATPQTETLTDGFICPEE